MTEKTSWYFYDFANSVFSTTVVTVLFGPYFTSLAEQVASTSTHTIPIFGMQLAPGSLYPLLISFSVLLQVFVLPFFASVADNTNYRKYILILSAYIGAFSTLCLYFVTAETLLLGAVLFIVANIAFGLSCNIYNSYLCFITTPEDATRTSSIGWALGYVGGGALLGLNIIFINNASVFSIDEPLAIRISLASAGLWWALFSLIPAKHLRTTPKQNTTHTSFYAIINIIKDISKHRQAALFLLAYMLFNDGVQSVIVLASQFGAEELGLQMDTLLTAILIVQFIAIFGSLLFNIIAKKFGEILTLRATLFVWLAVILFAFFALHTKPEFYFVCGVVGLIMGGTQAISRSIYSTLIPAEKSAQYFSIYELSEKGTSWLGPLAFAIVYQVTLSYRLALLSLALFFITGLLLLFKVRRA